MTGINQCLHFFLNSEILNSAYKCVRQFCPHSLETRLLIDKGAKDNSYYLVLKVLARSKDHCSSAPPKHL